MNYFSSLSRKLLAALLFIMIVSVITILPLKRSDETNAQTLNITNIVMQYVKKYYVDQSVVDPRLMMVRGLDKMERVLDQVLVYFPDGENSDRFNVQVFDDTKEFDMSRIQTVDDIPATLQAVFEFVSPNLAPTDPEITDVEYAVVDEMLKTLDMHSGIITPQVYKEFMIETEGSFGGLGIVIGIRDGDLTVISPIEGTPAYRKGIKPNDKIIQIENESTINMSLIEAVSKLRGSPGSQVTIYVNREGLSEPKEYVITRDIIKIESVETFDLDNGIRYVRIRDFQKNTLDSILENLDEGEDAPKGMILDLRGNPGGLLDQAERVSDLFLESGVIVTTKVGNSAKRYHANNKDHEFKGSVVVLVDAGSASASEIVAGALKNNERAVIIGERTFGKGSVQQIFDLKDGSALKLTIAQYLTPGDISIQDVGVTPDIILNPAVISEKSVLFNSRNRETLLEPLGRKNKPEVELDKPMYSIRYLDDRVIEDEEEITPEEAMSREERKEKLSTDFYVTLAKDILASSTTPSRQESLGSIEKEIDQISQNEEQKIVYKWKDMGVDWSYAKTQAQPSIAVSVSPEIPRGVAGEEIDVTVEVQNTGKEPIYRLLATTDSEDVIFKGKELIFGKLEPGEKKSWSTKFEVPKWALTREDLITLKFQDGNNSDIKDASFVTMIEGLPRPLYSYSYEVVDDGRFGSEGNGNGIAELDETVVLSMKVKNIGAGISEKASMNLKNDSGETIFLENGRDVIENLGTAETKDAHFMFKVVQPDNLVDLELQFIDEVFREGVISKLVIPIDKDDTGYKENKYNVRVSADNTPIRGGGYSEAPIIGLAPEGAVFGALGASEKWVKVKLGENEAGWIRRSKTSKSDSAPAENGPEYTMVFDAPPIIRVKNLPTSTPGEMLQLSGDIMDTDGINLISVFVGEDKVAMFPASDKQVPVSVEVKLSDEINLITIVAKDSKGLQSRQSFVVRNEGYEG